MKIKKYALLKKLKFISHIMKVDEALKKIILSRLKKSIKSCQNSLENIAKFSGNNPGLSSFSIYSFATESLLEQLKHLKAIEKILNSKL